MGQYRELAEKIVRERFNVNMPIVDAIRQLERLIAAHFAERDAAARRLVREAEAAAEYLFDHCGDTDDVRKIATSLRTAARAAIAAAKGGAA